MKIKYEKYLLALHFYLILTVPKIRNRIIIWN